MSDGRIDGKFTVEKGSSFSKALYDELHLSTKQGNSIWLKIEKIIKDEEESLGDLWKVNAGQEFELKESTMKKILDLVNKKFKTSHTLGKRPAQNPDKKPGEPGFNDNTKSAFSTASNEPIKGTKKEGNKSQKQAEPVENSDNAGKTNAGQKQHNAQGLAGMSRSNFGPRINSEY